MSTRAINLKKNIIKSLGSKYLSYLFQVMSLIFYARLFSPETQGLIAILVSINVFFITVSEGTITTSLITRNNLNESQINGVFTFSFLVGVVSALVNFSISFCYLNFSNVEYDSTIIYLVSIGVFFNILLTVPKSLLYLRSKYYFISIALILSEIITFTLIYFSYNSDSALLFSMKFFTIPLITFILFYFYCFKLSGKFYSVNKDFSGVLIIKDFMQNSFGFNFLNYFSRNLDNLLMIKFFDATTLGLYEKSYSLMKYPIQLLTSAVNPAIQPSLTINGFDVNFAKKCYDIVFNYLIVIGFIISIFIQINATTIVGIILGDSWLQVAPMIAILSISLPIQIITSFNGGFWNSADKSNLQFKVSIVNFVIFIPSLFIAFFYFKEIENVVVVITFLLILTCSYACVEIRKRLFNVPRYRTILYLFPKYFLFLCLSYSVINYVEANLYYLISSFVIFVILFLWLLYKVNCELKSLGD